MKIKQAPFWSASAAETLHELDSRPAGLTATEARDRLNQHGPNRLRAPKKSQALGLLLAQFKSPIILILLGAAVLSLFVHDRADAVIILAIVFLSGFLGFWQERGAAHAVAKLLEMVQTTVTVRRDGRAAEIPAEQVVPGDVVELSAGSGVPGDCLILESKDLYLDEAALTGETYPVEKSPGVVPPDAPLAKRTNALFMGAHVVSGAAAALVVRTAAATEFGQISARLALRPQETEFERGVRRFGYLLMEVTLVLLVAIFGINVYLDRPVLEAFLFALALAVGLTPQLLPAIISVNLAHGAKRMAEDKVIVKRLASIENLGSMDVLFSDKTGTLTEGVVRLYRALDLAGNDSEEVLLHAYLNAFFETGFANPIDNAIRRHQTFDLSAYEKLDESPYDFVRKRLSILVRHQGRGLMVTKGALLNVLSVCSEAAVGQGAVRGIGEVSAAINQQYEQFSAAGYRVLGLAVRNLGAATRLGQGDEAGMLFLGFLVFHDPPKEGVIQTVRRLKNLGVSLRIITGDNHLVAASVGAQVGLPQARILTGPQLRQMSDEALIMRVDQVEIFAEVEPNQKERILLAAKKAGHVVGYMGDGINDASALHAADVSLSVEGAVDVAKEAADIVLLEKDLEAIVRGVRGGRVTFANTLKYVFMATSANFGNMFSMAGASLFLPFLPLLPQQVLLTNLLTDFPEMTIATDSVDDEMVEQPRRWNIAFIRRFMITFGVLSSFFDFATFAVLLLLLKAGPEQFRTGWFVESVVSASLIVLVVRSRRLFWKSKPSRPLLLSTLAVVVGTVALPFTPLGRLLEFTPLPAQFWGALGLIVVGYVLAAEAAKRLFYAREKASGRLPEAKLLAPEACR